jgi:type I restriction enzyme S subunit
MSAWSTVELGTVATIDRTVVLPVNIDASTPYVGLENIERGGAIVNVATVGESKISSAKFRFTERQVLFGKLRPYLAKISRPNFSGVCSTDILPILPRADLDRDYLWHFLSLPGIIALAASRTSGASLPRLAPKELAKFQVPLPPIAEQRRIAQLLDSVDALRVRRRKTIALLDELAQSIFLDMFGDPDRSWSQATVEEIAGDGKGAIRTDPFGSQLLHDEFVDSGVSILAIDNVVTNEFQWKRRRFITKEKYKKLTRYTVYPGDVLITIMGTCGRCTIVPDGIPVAINTKYLCCITLDRSRCLPEFLHSYFLMHQNARLYLSRTTKGAIMDGLNMAIIKKLPIMLPLVNLQQVFVNRIRSLCAVKMTHTIHLAELDALFVSLQHRAFRGELWVNSPAA